MCMYVCIYIYILILILYYIIILYYILSYHTYTTPHYTYTTLHLHHTTGTFNGEIQLCDFMFASRRCGSGGERIKIKPGIDDGSRDGVMIGECSGSGGSGGVLLLLLLLLIFTILL